MPSTVSAPTPRRLLKALPADSKAVKLNRTNNSSFVVSKPIIDSQGHDHQLLGQGLRRRQHLLYGFFPPKQSNVYVQHEKWCLEVRRHALQ